MEVGDYIALLYNTVSGVWDCEAPLGSVYLLQNSEIRQSVSQLVCVFCLKQHFAVWDVAQCNFVRSY
jgi:hypothetical protein